MPDALGVLMRDCSLPAPLAVLHLFTASTVHHKRETVRKTRHGNEMISKLFGLHRLINSLLEYLLWHSFSGQGDVNIQSSLFGSTCHKTLRWQLDKCQEIPIGLWQICQIANITLASHIPLSHHVIGLWNCVPVLKAVPTSLAAARQGKEGNVSYVLPILDFCWALKYHLLTRWAKPDRDRDWWLTLETQFQFRVVQKWWLSQEKIIRLETQLFPPSSEEKTRCWMEYAKVIFGLQATTLTVHPEGYSKLHSQKVKFSYMWFRLKSYKHCGTKVPIPHQTIIVTIFLNMTMRHQFGHSITSSPPLLQ